MPAISANQLTSPYQTVFIPFGANANGAVTQAGAYGYRLWVTTQPTYVLGITVLEGAGTAAGTLQAAYSTDLYATTAMTLTNFGDSAVNMVASTTLELPIAKSGVTDDEKPLLLPANVAVGFNANASVVNTSKILGVIIKYRCP